ncbi:hypothetical protein SAMN05444141_103212 [Pseudovibrio denitrificans]|uniref:Uncharacterized protein n=1 Tax=Pseudovibrio denitrificans TaxID=258256 RepID=A0A1I7AN71_9HYPH|nr:hypothetical protein [Pseudovibrio denitrificans]SFT76273.1 hypothetical protein SAMN05444141_103212 [Pseudovibrio denitrificans]
MKQFNTAIIENPTDVERRLADFNLTIEQVTTIRDVARAYADDASPLMPLNAPGTLAYIFGVETLREQVLGEGWVIDRTSGIEAVVNHSLGIRIGFQNVDQACDRIFKPLPRSEKGPGAEKMCNLPLFEFHGIDVGIPEVPENQQKTSDPHSETIATYFVMIGEDGSVELSCPIIEKKRYKDFRERIFIDGPKEQWDMQIEDDTGPVDDFEIVISPKETA